MSARKIFTTLDPSQSDYLIRKELMKSWELGFSEIGEYELHILDNEWQHSIPEDLMTNHTRAYIERFGNGTGTTNGVRLALMKKYSGSIYLDSDVYFSAPLAPCVLLRDWLCVGGCSGTFLYVREWNDSLQKVLDYYDSPSWLEPDASFEAGDRQTMLKFYSQTDPHLGTLRYLTHVSMKSFRDDKYTNYTATWADKGQPELYDLMRNLPTAKKYTGLVLFGDGFQPKVKRLPKTQKVPNCIILRFPSSYTRFSSLIPNRHDLGEVTWEDFKPDGRVGKLLV